MSPLIRQLSPLKGCATYTEWLIQKARWSAEMFTALSAPCGPAAFATGRACSQCLLPHAAVPGCSKEIPEVCYTEVMFLPTQVQNDFLCIPSFILFGDSNMSQYVMHVVTSFCKRCPPTWPSLATRQQKKGSFCEAFKEEVWRNMHLFSVQWLLNWAVVGSPAR